MLSPEKMSAANMTVQERVELMATKALIKEAPNDELANSIA